MQHVRRMGRLGILVGLLAALTAISASAHISGHPIIYSASGVRAVYWTYNHAWTVYPGCGGNYTLAIANDVYKNPGGTSVTFYQVRTYAYNLQELNPGAGSFMLTSEVNGGTQWYLSFTGWKSSVNGIGTNTIPTSGYIYYNTNYTGGVSSSGYAWMEIWSAAGNDFGGTCEQLDKVFYK